MMDKELIKALEFYKSDIEEYKSFVNQSIDFTRQGRKDEELYANELGYIEGLKQGIKVVEMIFGGRIKDGF